MQISIVGDHMDIKSRIFIEVYKNYKEGKETRIKDIDVPSKYYYIEKLAKDRLVEKKGKKLRLIDEKRGKIVEELLSYPDLIEENIARLLLSYPDLIEENIARLIERHCNKENRVKIDTVKTGGYRGCLRALFENNQINYFSQKPIIFGYLDKHHINNLLEFFGYKGIDFDEKDILFRFFPDVPLTENQKKHLAFLEKILHRILETDSLEGNKLKDIAIFRGGTCLSLYYIPYRLSVDIDLAYRTDALKKNDAETNTQFSARIENINRKVRDNAAVICKDLGLGTENIHFTGSGKSLRITFVDGYKGNIDLTYPDFFLENYKKSGDIYIDSIENIFGDKLTILFSRENAKITDLTDIFCIMKRGIIEQNIVRRRLLLRLESEGVDIEFISKSDPGELNAQFTKSHESRDRLLFMLPPNHPAAEIKDFTPFIRYIQNFTRGLHE